jgi:hypothetical protein
LAFTLRPADAGCTRLTSRFRLDGRPRLSIHLLYTLLIEIPHFVMERKMLLGVKVRAERQGAQIVRPPREAAQNVR